MTQKPSLTAILTMLLACVGLARADSLEDAATKASGRFDLTARSGNAAPVNGTGMGQLGAMTADMGLQFNQASPSRAGAPKSKKEVPAPGNPNAGGKLARVGEVAQHVGLAVFVLTFAAIAVGVVVVGVGGFLALTAAVAVDAIKASPVMGTIAVGLGAAAGAVLGPFIASGWGFGRSKGGDELGPM